jgi:LPS sulfotransferase NodH
VSRLSVIAGPDADPPREPDLSYVVCSVPRTGSTLLCRGLQATGRAGSPYEYLEPTRMAELVARWDCGTETEAYVHALRTRRVDANGVFGTKLHWYQLEALGEPARLLELLPGARFARIVRRDLDAQAVSHWIALLTQRSFQVRGTRAPRRLRPWPYDYAAIARLRLTLEHGQARWTGFFAAHGIEPVEVVYEELAARYEDEVRRVLAALVPGATVAEVPPPSLEVQSTDATRRLVERFRADRARRGDELGPPTLRTRLRHVRRARFGR